MLRLREVIKPWKESAALNSHINLYGFWNQTAFLTKSGDLGMVLQVGGVDYESLDHAEQEYAVKRLEAALKAFGPGFHVYGPQQYPSPTTSGQQQSSLIQPRAAGDSPASATAQASIKRGPEVNVDSAVGQPYVVYDGTTVDTC
jgi:hypothetical protein